MTDDAVNGEDRRRNSRICLVLPGRYMLADGSEYSCETIDVSAHGVAIKAAKVGRYGERIVAYIQDLGRVEGHIVRRAIGKFAIDISSPQNKIDRLADRISWITHRGADGRFDRREVARLDVWHEKSLLRTEDGREYAAELLDVSLEGAALQVEVTLPVGAHVTLGEQTAFVLRCFPGGLAVTFEAPPSRSALEVAPALAG